VTHAPDISDEDLLAAFVAGDGSAFAALVERYERRVLGICLRYFRDPADAEDAAQEAFVALYRRAGTFRGGAALSTWMYRVTTNACNDLARRRSRRPQAADQAAPDLELADPRDEVGEHLLRMELREALDALDPAHRRAVVGHTVEGRPYHELAEAEGVAVGTMKSRVHRGLGRLAAILAARDAEVPAPPGRSDRGPAVRPAPTGGEPSERGPPPTP
jgi:RNA polymerase sigma-70 factor, ECF subfamily